MTEKDIRRYGQDRKVMMFANPGQVIKYERQKGAKEL